MKQIIAALAFAASVVLDPAATLRPDAFDAPAPESMAEASKSAPAHEAAPEAHIHQQEAEEALYVCPMHPEVTSNEPGKCPKCGMTLVRKKP
ncbi:MAG TPA: heavy metal-binding domain-containing protein [Thermoanaerobaculia bacterium]|nr:heavy metal-binding domain-containing protein [Thermoanaerobaculia bacterium]